MKMLKILSLFVMLLVVRPSAAAIDSNDTTFIVLRDSMSHAFNDGDSARFFAHVRNLQNYLLSHDDLHGYYTQRCNEIVFLMNKERIYEAYKLAHQLSRELRERKLDKEMFMAYNMMGHIYRYCGNKEEAKRCFRKVIQLMDEADYRSSMPPIYMNIVNVEMDEDPQEALRLLEKAIEIAQETSPERVFDIETRRTISYYNMGDREKFLEGYRAYKEGEAKGMSSVHGRQLEVYYQASLGNTDEAIRLARDVLGDDSYSTMANIYKDAGRWKEAYEALQKEALSNDSINGVILSNSMDGIRDEMRIYEAERETVRTRIILLCVIIATLLILSLALGYLFWARRRHLRELKVAYDRVSEADRVKTAFIRNVSHEVRTPLNIISGFTQVVADPDFSAGPEERQNIAEMITKNTKQITSLIDEMLLLSLSDADAEVQINDQVDMDELMRDTLQERQGSAGSLLQISYESHLPAGFHLLTNEQMLHHIVGALVDNAIKYTEQGAVHLQTALSADGSSLSIAVEDTGIGIPEGQEEKIFERFVKLDTFQEGLGLGLPVARTLARRLGGDVRLDTSYHKGARFVAELTNRIN